MGNDIVICNSQLAMDVNMSSRDACRISCHIMKSPQCSYMMQIRKKGTLTQVEVQTVTLIVAKNDLSDWVRDLGSRWQARGIPRGQE